MLHIVSSLTPEKPYDSLVLEKSLLPLNTERNVSDLPDEIRPDDLNHLTGCGFILFLSMKDAYKASKSGYLLLLK
uniref:Integrase n=1 Tax=Strongyloides venezuelensis TaxID=75913 RepID=A0A0K0G562_STRVS